MLVVQIWKCLEMLVKRAGEKCQVIMACMNEAPDTIVVSGLFLNKHFFMNER